MRSRLPVVRTRILVQKKEDDEEKEKSLLRLRMTSLDEIGRTANCTTCGVSSSFFGRRVKKEIKQKIDDIQPRFVFLRSNTSLVSLSLLRVLSSFCFHFREDNLVVGTTNRRQALLLHISSSSVNRFTIMR